MKTRDDIENYILNLGVPVNEVAQGTWVLADPMWNGLQIVVQLTDPLLVYRVKLFGLDAVPVASHPELFRRLLQLNATDMVQGGYALEDDSVVAVEVMPLENLDENEFQSAIDCLTFALTVHYPELTTFLTK
jgi:hypothetical protein